MLGPSALPLPVLDLRPPAYHKTVDYVLGLVRPAYFRLRRGQTLDLAARTFSLPPRVLAAANALDREPEEGQVLFLPAGGNLYRVRGGERKKEKE